MGGHPVVRDATKWTPVYCLRQPRDEVVEPAPDVGAFYASTVVGALCGEWELRADLAGPSLDSVPAVPNRSRDEGTEWLALECVVHPGEPAAGKFEGHAVCRVCLDEGYADPPSIRAKVMHALLPPAKESRDARS